MGEARAKPLLSMKGRLESPEMTLHISSYRLFPIRVVILLALAAIGPMKAASGDEGGRVAVPGGYKLGPDDQIAVKVLDAEEISSGQPVSIKVDDHGNITLPLVGRLEAANLTTEQLEAQLRARLTKYLHDPDVTVYLLETRSQPISILGAAQAPGIYQVQGRKTLFEAIAMAGGLKSDAGDKVKITRRMEWGTIPLPTALADSTGQYSVASVSVKSVMEAKNPQENIQIRPNDVISIPRAEVVYVVGAVHKAGGYTLGENEKVSALQALALAEGLERNSAAQKATIMRPVAGGSQRAEVPVDLKKIMEGKSEDLSLQANDILFVPTSAGKNAALRGLEAAIQIGTGVAIYRR